MQVFFNSHLETILWRYQFYTGIYDQSILKWLKYKYFQEIFLRNVIYCILVATVVNCLDQLYSEFPYYFSFLVDNLLALNETQQKLCLFNFRFFSEKLSVDYFISKFLFYLTVQRLLFQFVRVSSKILFKHAGYIQLYYKFTAIDFTIYNVQSNSK